MKYRLRIVRATGRKFAPTSIKNVYELYATLQEALDQAHLILELQHQYGIDVEGPGQRIEWMIIRRYYPDGRFVDFKAEKIPPITDHPDMMREAA